MDQDKSPKTDDVAPKADDTPELDTRDLDRVSGGGARDGTTVPHLPGGH